MSKIRILIPLLLLVMLQFVYSQDNKKTLNIKSGNVVKVGKNIITQDELDRTYTEMNNLASIYGKNITKKDVLDLMIDDYLIKDKIKTEPLVLDESMYNQELNSMKSQFVGMKQSKDDNYQYNDDDFKKYIETEGKMNYADFEEKIKQKVLVRQYLYKIAGTQLQALYRKTYESSQDFPITLPSSNGTETINSLREIYDQNEESFIMPSRIILKHIYFTTFDAKGPLSTDDKKAVREKAEDALRRLKNGDDFDKLCFIYSDDPTAKEEVTEPTTNTKNRGYIGPFPLSGKYAKMTKDKYGEAIFNVFLSMKKGQFSDIVESPYGYHIFYAINKTDKQFVSFEDAKSSIVEQLKSAEEQNILQQVYLDLIKDLKMKADIKYFMKEYE